MYKMKYMLFALLCIIVCGCGKMQKDTLASGKQESIFVEDKNANAENTNECVDNKIDRAVNDMDSSKQEHLENMEPVEDTVKDNVIVACKGVISGNTYGKAYDYEIQLIEIDAYKWKMKFEIRSQGKVVHNLEEDIDDEIFPQSIRTPVTVADVNADGYWDFIIDYGIPSQVHKEECIVWNPQSYQYEILTGYSDLCNTVFDGHTGVIYEAYWGDAAVHVTNKYVANGNTLELVATMIADYSSGSARYTEKQKEDGGFVIVQDNLPERKMSFDGWLYY